LRTKQIKLIYSGLRDRKQYWRLETYTHTYNHNHKDSNDHSLNWTCWLQHVGTMRNDASVSARDLISVRDNLHPWNAVLRQCSRRRRPELWLVLALRRRSGALSGEHPTCDREFVRSTPSLALLWC